MMAATALPTEGGPWVEVYGRRSATASECVYEGPAGAISALTVSRNASGRIVAVLPWWQDPALPALARLHERHPDAVPVRYRPGKRCTLRKGSLFLKCLADAGGEAINRDARLLWQAYGEGRLAFGVARPGGWLPAMNMVVQHRVPGEPVVDRLWTADGEPLAYRLGRANASLALSGIRPAARFTYADQMKRTAKYARRLAEHMPQAWPEIARLMDRLARVAAGPADRPIHGAPHAHQWLDGPDGAQLVDFDRFGLGDPELEVATFVGEADFERSPHAAATGAAYCAGFEAVLPLDPDLLTAYRVHKHLAKALRTARAVRPDAHARAMAVLAGAGRLLEHGA